MPKYFFEHELDNTNRKSVEGAPSTPICTDERNNLWKWRQVILLQKITYQSQEKAMEEWFYDIGLVIVHYEAITTAIFPNQNDVFSYQIVKQATYGNEY